MKNLLFIFLILTSVKVLAQDHRIIIQGKVTSESVPVINAHIINYSAKKGVITNKQGLFEIPVKLSDTLVVSSIQHKQQIVVISSNHITQNFLNISLVEAVTELEEIIVKEHKDFLINSDTAQYAVNATTLNLPNAGKKILTPTERKVNYIRKGGTIDQIRALITGEKKKLKKLLKDENTFIAIQHIRADFGDEFFTKNLGLEQKDIGPFLEYCTLYDILNEYSRGNKYGVFDIFIKKKSEFLELQKEVETPKD